MTCKDLQQLIRKAVKRGWDVTITNGGHYHWRHETGRFFYTASTPSCGRALKNIKARMRKIENGRGWET